MSIPAASYSLPAALAIALGATKATDLIKSGLAQVGLDRIPPVVKGTLATTLAVGGAVLVESTPRSRMLTGCAAAGLAGVVHQFERACRRRADYDVLRAVNEVTRVRR